MLKRYRQLWVKDLPKVPTWRLEWDSNLPPSKCKAPKLPLSHHAPFVVAHYIAPFLVCQIHLTEMLSSAIYCVSDFRSTPLVAFADPLLPYGWWSFFMRLTVFELVKWSVILRKYRLGAVFASWCVVPWPSDNMHFIGQPLGLLQVLSLKGHQA